MTSPLSLEARLDRVEWRFAIAELVTDYAIACDEHDMAKLTSLFTADAAFDSPNGAMDHGCGVSQQLLKQLNRGTTLPGIGIAGVRERVRMLGGLTEICSGSRGTTVRVRLPMRRPPAARRSVGITDASGNVAHA